jgi:hypothetical protein
MGQLDAILPIVPAILRRFFKSSLKGRQAAT